jgi:hypothetical protein
MRALLLAAAVSLAPVALWGQEAADPRATRPERPTVATHAWTVAPRHLELETGVEWDRNPDASHTVLTPTLLKIGIAARTQPGFQANLNQPPGASLGVADVAILLKQRLADSLPVLGAFAVIPSVKFSTGGLAHGTGTTIPGALGLASAQFSTCTDRSRMRCMSGWCTTSVASEGSPAVTNQEDRMPHLIAAPTVIEAAGNLPKRIEEHVGYVPRRQP